MLTLCSHGADWALPFNGSDQVTFGAGTVTPDATSEAVVSVANPYADVDWATVSTFKGNLHTHTTQSDGNQAPSAVLDGYQAQNYDFLAVTDHDKVTYPWTTYGRDPMVLGMTDIQGNELSLGHHIVSLFNGFTSSSADAGVLLSGVANAGGISFFAHPGRYSYSAQWYADYYTAQPSCFGMEIYNQGDRYTGDRVKWDAVLSILMPTRPVWGLSNDDSHDASHIGRNRTYLLAPSVSHADVRSALEAGAFFATYSTSSAHVPPMLTNVVIDAVAGTITVQGTGFTQVRWISQGTQVATGATLDLLNTSGVAKYVRAELHGTEGIGYTNPFGLLPTGNQAPTVTAGSDLTVTLPTAATLAGSASDDGLPTPPAALTLLWEKVSGLGTVTFANAAAAQTTATFSQAGTYVLRLTASDGVLSASDDVTVTVNAAGGPTGWTAYNDCSWKSGQFNTRITTYGLNQSGAMVEYATGAALPVSLQIVNNPAVPANADGTGGPMPNAGTDAHNTFNGIVSFANVIWYGNSGWWVDAVVTGLDPNRRYEFATSVNRGNATYTTRWSKFTLSGVDAATQASTSGVQVNSDTSVSFWSGNNSANGYVARWTEIRSGSDGSFTVRAQADGQSGHSTYQAYAFDGLLLRDLGPATPANQAPTVSAGSDQAITLPADATLAGSASDDGLPNPPAALTLLWEKVSGEGAVTFANAAAAQTTATFSQAGTYVLRLTASDDALSASAEMTVTVEPAPAPEPASWVAYNDCVFQPAAYKHANATPYNIGSGSPGPASGELRDLASGTVLPVTVTLTQSGGVVWQPDPVTGGSDCATGTDADQTFGGIVSMGGVIHYGSAGWTADATLTGLDPDGVYEFATSANRNSASYPNRRSVYTLLGVDTFHAASTPGVVEVGASATFNTGDNTANGYVARWIGIRPGADGSFTVRATHASDAESGNKAYAFDVFMVRRLQGFHAWAQTQGHAGDVSNTFSRVNESGMPFGMQYAIGKNFRADEPMLTIRMVNGKPVVDVPAQDDSSLPHVRLRVKGATNIDAAPEFWLPLDPLPVEKSHAPSHRAWFDTKDFPRQGFFRLSAELQE